MKKAPDIKTRAEPIHVLSTGRYPMLSLKISADLRFQSDTVHPVSKLVC